MPTPRTHLGGVAVNGYLYVIGGSTIAGFGGQNLHDRRAVQRANQPLGEDAEHAAHALGVRPRPSVAGGSRSSVGSAAAA